MSCSTWPLSPRGRGVGERGLLQSTEDARQDALFIVENVRVPETQDSKALVTKIGVAALIAMAFGMLPAIDLDDQTRGKANEVGDVEIERHLPPEFVIRQAMSPKQLPQPMLRIGRVRTHDLGSATQFRNA